MTNSQLHCIKVPLQAQPCDVFTHFHHLAGAIFLDSASDEHVNSRFDIIAINPQKWLSVKDAQVTIDEQPIQGDVFTLMQDQLATLCNDKAPHDLPFSGGWLGYFGYDLGRILERMPELAQNDIDLAQMQVGLYIDALIFDKAHNQWFYVAQPDVDADTGLAQYLSLIAQQPAAEHFALTSTWQSNMSYEFYAQQFAKIQDYLRSGDCYQINLAQRFSAQYQGCEWQAYQRLRAHNRAPFSAFIRLRDGAILSISQSALSKLKIIRSKANRLKARYREAQMRKKMRH